MIAHPPFAAPAALYRATVTEAQFRALLLEALPYHGWRLLFAVPDAAYRELRRLPASPSVRAALAALADWPDLLIGTGGRSIYAELKRDGGKPTAGQRETLRRLHAAGQEVRLWMPKHWDAEIVPTLRGERAPPNPETLAILAA